MALYKEITIRFALLLFVAAMLQSCSTEPMAEVSDDDYVTISFFVESESAETRDATNDNTDTRANVDRLIYAVYDKNGNLLEQYGEPQETEILGKGQSMIDIDNSDNSFPVSVTLRLMRGQEYKIAFWMQNKDSQLYNTKDLHNVTLATESVTFYANDDKSDAFCKTEHFTVAENEVKAVVLRRPFAQLNVGMHQTDYEQFATDIAQSSVTVSGIASAIDVVNNTIAGTSQELTFALASLPAAPLYIRDYDGEEGNTEFKYLLTCYFPIADNADELTSADYGLIAAQFSFADNLGNIRYRLEETQLHVYRNWRTNIILTAETMNMGGVEQQQTINNNQIIYCL